MMSKERLEERINFSDLPFEKRIKLTKESIQKDLKASDYLFPKNVYINTKYILEIIEQAERVQELEEENRFQMSETHKNLDKVIYLDKEKERYKQALEQVEGFLVKANKFYVNNRDFAVNYNINEALEVIKELKGES